MLHLYFNAVFSYYFPYYYWVFKQFNACLFQLSIFIVSWTWPVSLCPIYRESMHIILLWLSQAYLLEPEFWWLVEYTFCVTLFDSSWQLLSVHIKVKHRQYVNGRFIHSKIYVAPLQGNYTEVLLTPAWPKWTVLQQL